MTLLGRQSTLFVGLAVAVQLWGCGKKGPPEVPLLLLPDLVTDLMVRRFGEEVHVSFTLPTRNQDGTAPADLDRVDVYAMTTQPRFPRDRILELDEFEEAATMVVSIEVRPPQVSDNIDAGEVKAADDLRPAQGFPVAIYETLTAETLVPIDPWEDERREDDEEELEKPTFVPLVTPPQPGPLQREYAVVVVSGGGNEAEAMRIAVPLGVAPSPPPAPVVTYTEEAINISWELPPGVRAVVQGSEIFPEAAPLPSRPLVEWPPAAAISSVTLPPDNQSNTGAGQAVTDLSLTPASPPLRFSTIIAWPHVEVIPPRSLDSVPLLPFLPSSPIIDWPPASRYGLYEFMESQDGSQTIPQPVNATPLTVTSYADERLEFGLERCYAIGTLDVLGGLDVRSVLSGRTCLTFVDIFPPVVPQGLTAVSGEGAISLIWNPNDEEDLAGYLVLRGLSPGETLQPLSSEPVLENIYRDSAVEPGVRYVYAIRAVDNATPPNVSLPSSTVEDTAR